jgi:uncharacterized membrane protein HdeD (DUF308 family)
MLDKLNKLSFVIGLFFLIVAIILLANYLINNSNHQQVNLYVGIVFLVFGAIMMSLKNTEN